MKKKLEDPKILIFSAEDTVTMAVAMVHGKVLTASARRNPVDVYDEQIGADLAVARLLVKMARRLERQANGRVRHANYVRMDQLRRDARRVEQELAASRPAAPTVYAPKVVTHKKRTRKVENVHPTNPRV